MEWKEILASEKKLHQIQFLGTYRNFKINATVSDKRKTPFFHKKFVSTQVRRQILDKRKRDLLILLIQAKPDTQLEIIIRRNGEKETWRLIEIPMERQQ